MSFMDEIESLISERVDAVAARDAAQARIDAIDTEIAEVRALLGLVPQVAPVAEAPTRKRRSDAGVPRKIATPATEASNA